MMLLITELTALISFWLQIYEIISKYTFYLQQFRSIGHEGEYQNRRTQGDALAKSGEGFLFLFYLLGIFPPEGRLVGLGRTLGHPERGLVGDAETRQRGRHRPLHMDVLGSNMAKDSFPLNHFQRCGKGDAAKRRAGGERIDAKALQGRIGGDADLLHALTVLKGIIADAGHACRNVDVA